MRLAKYHVMSLAEKQAYALRHAQRSASRCASCGIMVDAQAVGDDERCPGTEIRGMRETEAGVFLGRKAIAT